MRHRGPLLLCLAVAAAMMSPLLGDRFVVSPADDAAAHVSGVIEARNALFEGQFPIRVAPSHDGGAGGEALGGVRVPLFQFYGNFPYTAGGLLYAAGLSPYTAWKAVQFASLVCGGFFTYLAAWRATRRPRVAALAGLAFMTAPYVWCDLHARFAFTELVAFCLLPPVYYFAERAFASPRKRYVVLGGAAWALLSLSHNVAYLYASTYFGLYFLSRLGLPRFRKSIKRLLRVGFAYALGVLLVLWYLVPQLTVLKLLNIHFFSGVATPVGAELLTSIDVLLWPWMRVPRIVTDTPRLGLQVGWVLLAGVVLSMAALTLRRTPRRAVVLRLVVLFIVALFMTWSPVNFWRYLPQQLAYVQSTYRILMFVTLFGALLVAFGLAATVARRRDLGWPATLLLACVVAGAAWSYVPRHETRSPRTITALIQKPAGNLNRDYIVAPQAAAHTTFVHPDINWAEPTRGVFPPFSRFVHRYFMKVRAPREPGTRVEIAGAIPTARGKPARLAVVLDDKVLFDGPAGPGDFSFVKEIPGPMSNDVTWITFTATFPDSPDAQAEIVMRTLRFLPPAPENVPFVPAVVSRHETDVERGRVEYHRGPGPAALVELPVVYYPELIRVRRSGGEDVPYGNVGRLLALQVPEGPLRVKISFVGVAWANAVSGAAWVGFVVLPCAAFAVSRLRRIHWRRPRILPGSAAAWAAFAALPLVVLGVRPIHHYLTLDTFKPFPCTATASRGADSPERDDPAHAFDGDDGTTWNVHNGAQAATLTIVPKTPAKFTHLALLAREGGLWEAWHTVHVELFEGDKTVLSQTFELPTADSDPLQHIRFTPTRADKIVLTFSNPVIVTRDGKTRVNPDQTSPGYREIRVE